MIDTTNKLMVIVKKRRTRNLDIRTICTFWTQVETSSRKSTRNAPMFMLPDPIISAILAGVEGTHSLFTDEPLGTR